MHDNAATYDNAALAIQAIGSKMNEENESSTGEYKSVQYNDTIMDIE